MPYKVIVGLASALLLGVMAITTTSSSMPRAQNTQHTEDLQLPVVITQMETENGVIPVELRCEMALLSAPDTLKDIPCALKNNTNQRISAAVITFSVTVEKDNTVIADSNVLSIETFVHPDIRAEHGNNLVGPGKEHPVRPQPISYEGGLIKGVTMQVDYVEFEDKTRSGPDRTGSRSLAEIREGAMKYKAWLVKKYNEGGRQLAAIIPLLHQDQPAPDEINLQSSLQWQGAMIYRNRLRQLYEGEGERALSKYFH
jgi:hypothetical protein